MARSRGSHVPPHVQICTDSEKIDLEAQNGLLQFDEIRRLASEGWANPSPVPFAAPTLRSLHQLAVADVYSDAGFYRTNAVTISGSAHVPPPADQVPDLVEEMVRYILENWDAKPVHLCAYVMWRCNWIHPFTDGNGRTTRAVSYLVFLLRLGYEPGGTPTFVDQISADKSPYYEALDLADAASREARLDVSAMEALISQLLAKQLLQIVSDAGAGR